MSRWLAEGRTLGASLRRFNCIVVAGSDPDATAEVALGIAEAQAEHRHVVLGDLLDDAARFGAFRIDDDHHGLVDVLHYGISLGLVTRPVAATAGLVFARTGSHIADYAELLEHPRWTRLIGPFVGSSDLLVIALPLAAAGLDTIVAHTDGVVLVDGIAPAKLDPARVIARVQPPPKPTIAPAGAAAVAAGPGVPRTRPLAPAVRPAAQSATRPSAQAATRPAPTAAVRPSRSVTPAAAAGKPIPGLGRRVVVGALVSLAGALFVYWLAERQTTDSEAPAKSVAATVPVLSQPRPSNPRSRPVDPNVMDPADSGGSVYAVQLSSANTQSGAILTLQRNRGALPAATYAQVTIGGTTWYKVLTGAFATRGGADSLLQSLRESKVVDSTLGIVVRVPYALRIDSLRSSATVGDALASLVMGRLPAYALEQKSGWVWIMVGAFETVSQADAYAETLRAVDLTPQLVLRKGRMF
jgi:septal ring-binding cell division protein DamX